MKLIDQAYSLEQSGRLEKAEHLYRHILTGSPTDAAGYAGLIRVLAKANPGRSFVEIYGDEFGILESAIHAGVWLPEAVVPLAVLYWEQRGEREKGVRLVQDYLRRETDLSRVREVLLGATDELYSQIPPDCVSILRLHETFQRESPIDLIPYDRLYPFLKGAPDDLQNAFFSLQRSDEWFATVEGLWRQIHGPQRTGLRPAYLHLMASGYRKTGRHDSVISIGRKYLRYFRETLSEPSRSSQLAQKYATLMASSYLAWGKVAQASRAFERTHHYLSRYRHYLIENPEITKGWTMDQFVEPFVNVGTGALLIERDADALAVFLMAESTCPGHLVVQFQLAGLSLKVEEDRKRAIRYLRRAYDIASSRRDTGGELVKSWFRSSRLFAAVQNDDEFLAALEGQ